MPTINGRPRATASGASWVAAPPGLWLPEMPDISLGAHSTNALINATGMKIAFIGEVRTPNRGPKNIARVHWRWGNITKAGGSVLVFSLQDVDAANGPVFRPDGTQDQTYTIPTADPVSGAWYRSGALSAVRAVNHGDLLAAVWEFDGAGRLGSDSYVVSSYQRFGEAQDQSGSAVFGGASWVASGPGDILLEFDDGTFGSFTGTIPSSALGSLGFKQNTGGADEYALELNYPFPWKTDGFYVYVSADANNADFDVVLYDGTSAMTNGTRSIDANQFAQLGRSWLKRAWGGEITCLANTTYRLAIKPTQTSNNVNMFYYDLNHQDHRQAIPGGANLAMTSRVDLGSWAAPTTTRIPLMGLRISALNGGAVS